MSNAGAGTQFWAVFDGEIEKVQQAIDAEIAKTGGVDDIYDHLVDWCKMAGWRCGNCGRIFLNAERALSHPEDIEVYVLERRGYPRSSD